RKIAVAIGFLFLVVVPLIASAVDEAFYTDLFTRVMIFAIAALSLDLILGYGGLVSFGHAAYLGVGAYSVGILSYYGIDNGLVQFGVAILAAALVSLFIGAVSLRTSGIAFVMITLAFAQMLSFLAIGVNMFGGDDGLSINGHSDFGELIDLSDMNTLYYFVFVILVFFTWFSSRFIKARFGMVLRGAKSNPRRMIALGFPIQRYQLTAFVISPAIMTWARSGEIMIMVILGGVSSLFGPILGAAIYLVLEHELSALTSHWLVILGPLMILIVLFAKRGMFGLLKETGHG